MVSFSNQMLAGRSKNSTTRKETLMFTRDNAAIVLIDHQDLPLSWVKSIPEGVTVANVRQLARIGVEFGVPLLVTSTMEDNIGTSISDIQELAPEAYANRVKRGGTLNCFLDAAFVTAVAALERKNLIIAGLTTDICLYNTVAAGLDAGYSIEVVADASGSSSMLSDAITFDRLRDKGAVITVGNQVLSELFSDFGTEEGQRAMQINLQEIAGAPAE